MCPFTLLISGYPGVILPVLETNSLHIAPSLIMMELPVYTVMSCILTALPLLNFFSSYSSYFIQNNTSQFVCEVVKYE